MFSTGVVEIASPATPEQKVWTPDPLQEKFLNRCHEEFDEKFCQYADAQIQSEGGYNPLRWAEYAEGFCSWGMFQNNVCIHQRWSHNKARYIYNVLTNPAGFHSDEYERLKKFEYLLDADWQIEELLRRYKARILRVKSLGCATQTIMGEQIHANIYCAIRLHNWNGGRDYVARVVSKKQELYK